MKMSFKIVLALVCAAALCAAQTDATSSSGTPAPANPTETNQNPRIQNAPTAAEPPPAAPAAAPPSDQLAPAPKPAVKDKAPAGTAEANPAGGRKSYVIGPLDVLLVTVWGQQNLSRPVDVGPDGMLSMPLIGEVKADGLTARQLKEVLTERLKEFLNNPEVDVQVMKNNSKRYFVYGGVGRPGEFPLSRDTTVMDALSLVGGFGSFTDTKKIRIQRGTQEFKFNYKDVSRGKHMEQNILLENGDRIFVPE